MRQSKEEISQQKKLYYKKNKEERKKYSNKYRIDNPEKVKNIKALYRQENKDKIKLYDKQYKRSYRKKQSKIPNYIKYGLNEDQYNDLLRTQNNKCAICGIDQDSLTYLLAIDHNHITGKVRGLLCHKCNLGLGCFNDDENTLLLSIKYLSKCNN